MNPILRELLNGLLVLVVASLLSVAFSAFQVRFNALLWVLILMGIAIAASGYILFEITLGVITSAEDRHDRLVGGARCGARVLANVLHMALRCFLFFLLSLHADTPSYSSYISDFRVFVF
jgi:hypothetical protein